MELKFKTKLNRKELDIQYYNIISDVYLKWEAKIHFDQQGISDIVANVPDQEISFLIEKETEIPGNMDDVLITEEEITLKITSAFIEYSRGETEDSRALGLLPIQLSCYKDNWTVIFCSYST